uniref:Glycine zipper-like domain-containing protein n=1 Tax=Thermosporothrix sp. COM3 TaxID=2490863 RepID=A0A455SKE7_9CHLR|nr:hypothetical protein KTC_25320 [Thermosporothrix sp. COM3]
MNTNPPQNDYTSRGTRTTTKASMFPAWISIGIAFGVVFGLLFHNLALGVGIGLSLGIAIGSGLTAAQSKKKETDGPER